MWWVLSPDSSPRLEDTAPCNSLQIAAIQDTVAHVAGRTSWSRLPKPVSCRLLLEGVLPTLLSTGLGLVFAWPKNRPSQESDPAEDLVTLSPVDIMQVQFPDVTHEQALLPEEGKGGSEMTRRLLILTEVGRVEVTLRPHLCLPSPLWSLTLLLPPIKRDAAM